MKNYKFNIALSVLNHLGRKLYRSFITVLGEAISNSWDADATEVSICIDKENNSITIIDNGIGMTDEDFQNKFLNIGYDKRQHSTKSVERKRPFIGRKGIGKLALLSCSERIHILSKTKHSDFIGGVIDNSSLDAAITEGATTQEYLLKPIDKKQFTKYTDNFVSGTILHLEEINKGINNNIDYIKKILSLYFRFSIIDPSFNIKVNNESLDFDDLKELIKNTQFVWDIIPNSKAIINNNIKDNFLTKLIKNTKLDESKKYSTINSNMEISGFIASVTKPVQLKIPNLDEIVTVDLFVNGRLREKNIIKYRPTNRIVENYIYGQIHFNSLDNEKDNIDRFTSSREGVLADDELFQKFLEEFRNNILDKVIDEWDKFRLAINQSGDPENTKRMKEKDRVARTHYYLIAEGYTKNLDSYSKKTVNKWIRNLEKDANYNIEAYVNCFISENLIRNIIIRNELEIPNNHKETANKFKKEEADNRQRTNMSIDIRKNPNLIQKNPDLVRKNYDLIYYLGMKELTSIVEPNYVQNKTSIQRDVKEYNLVRNAMAHTALLTGEAKRKLKTIFDNIKNRIQYILTNNNP